ncbi:MAG: MotA/TolQ/ExbB proton channel family protein [Candidatus Euphemobacter frigidus]|nr:MotA/TolQ/ExbB proton channel family protein [Candidatus Euphemobacter frigidus]MDP8276760.1 MotA/TolQ/ExbB proton channel family protein [Candidatus Euphemobacter frigidus]
MIPIFLCSVISLAVIIERGFSLRTARILPRWLVGLLSRSDQAIDGQTERIERDDSALARVLSVGFRNRNLGLEKNYEILQVAEKQAANRMERGLVLLEIVAVISPLLGLLGTVIGMVQVFDVISQIGAGHAQALSSGISQALISTIAGLVVAIPALIAYSVYTRKVDNLLLEIEKAVGIFLLRLYSQNNQVEAR